MGRPRKYNDEQVKEIQEQLEQYIEDTEIPIIVEFAYQYNVSRDSLYDYDEFSTLIKRAIDKKEAQLERKALNNEIDRTMAIFSLKQLGWSDKQDVKHAGSVTFEVMAASEYVKQDTDK
jgi:hypothetical protein